MTRTAAVLAAVLVAGCGLGPPPKDGEKKEEDKQEPAYRAGDPIEANGVRVTFRRAVVAELAGSQGREGVRSDLLRVEYDLENTSDVKVIEWGGWQGRCEVKDEHGNVFRAFRPASSFRFLFAEQADAYDGEARLDPGVKMARHCYFHKPPPSSKEGALTLDWSVPLAKARGRFGVRLPIVRER
jgi:hypothetical protein